LTDSLPPSLSLSLSPQVAERSAADLAEQLTEDSEFSHTPLDAEIAGFREKASLWPTPGSSTQLRDALLALSEVRGLGCCYQ
jgi:hypothetical protein